MKGGKGKIWKGLIFAVFFVMLAFVSVGCASATTRYVNPGDSIQDVVDVADPSDTVIVRDGTYTENVVVDVANLTLQSEHGSAFTTVLAAVNTSDVFLVTANSVTITGFTVRNATDSVSGIHLDTVHHCTVSDNNASGNYYGIRLSSSSNNTLTGNIASNNGNGIGLYSSSNNNTLTSNTANSNKYDGIILWTSSNNFLSSNAASNNTDAYGINLVFSSSDNFLSDNTVLNNWCGIGLYSSSNNNTLTGNTANSNNQHGIYLLDSSSNNFLSDNTANSNNNIGIYLYSSGNNNTLTGNTALNNTYGMHLSSSNNNTLTGNTASNNSFAGIYLSYSSNNHLTTNIANSSNTHYGIYLESSSNNTLTDNIANLNNYYGIALKSSSNNTLMGNAASNNGDGIRLAYSSNNNTLTSNTANSNNGDGIRLYFSSYNALVSNTANSNNNYGIYLDSSNGNHIYNNYFDNTNNAWDNGNNTWNISKTEGTNIVGGPYFGGNYWSDYTGEDLGDDGIGDTQLPYNSSDYIVNGGDYRPLVKRTHGFELQLASGYNMISIPVNDSLAITASDLAAKIGTSCTEVVRWDGASQAYVSHIPGLPLNNFATAAGAGYFVNVNNPTSVTFEGPGWTSPSVVALLSGYNMIGVPVNDSSVSTASTLAAKIGTGCTEVVRWDGNTQSYISHIPGIPLNDFAITGGQGYFVNVNSPVDVSFEGVTWED